MSAGGPLAGAFVDSPADAQRRKGLRRMRAIALALLLAAAVVYVATLDTGGFWGYVNAAAEAAMVGAIADWFAVTALFRHPLGLPIPHTAIIPTRKRLLGESLREFVADNFLAEDVVRDRIDRAEVSRRAGGWLADTDHSELVVRETSRMLRHGLNRIGDEDVAALVTEELLPRLADEPLSEVAGRLLQEVVADGAHHGLVDLTLIEAHRWLVGNTDTVTAVVGERAPWWSPRWLDETVARRVHREVVDWVRDIRDEPQHPARLALDGLLADLARDLQHDRDTIDRAERLKRRVLASPQVVTTATALWTAVRRALLESLDDPDGVVRTRAVAALVDFGRRLGDDEPLRRRLDGWAADFAAYVVNTYGAEMTTVISDTVDRWDGDEAARRIELHVGRDLQFIRINGTLVGALVGLMIHAVAELL